MVTQTADKADGQTDGRGQNRGGACSERQKSSEGDITADGAFSLRCNAISHGSTSYVPANSSVVRYCKCCVYKDVFLWKL